jgi:hypothetical protein
VALHGGSFTLENAAEGALATVGLVGREAA